MSNHFGQRFERLTKGQKPPTNSWVKYIHTSHMQTGHCFSYECRLDWRQRHNWRKHWMSISQVISLLMRWWLRPSVHCAVPTLIYLNVYKSSFSFSCYLNRTQLPLRDKTTAFGWKTRRQRRLVFKKTKQKKTTYGNSVQCFLLTLVYCWCYGCGCFHWSIRVYTPSALSRSWNEVADNRRRGLVSVWRVINSWDTVRFRN